MNKFIGAAITTVPMNCITDVAGSNTLVLATDLYHPIAIDADINTFIACIFSFMPCP